MISTDAMYVYIVCSRVAVGTGRRRIVDCVVRVAVETSVRGSAKEAGGMGAQGTDQLDGECEWCFWLLSRCAKQVCLLS